MKSWIHFLGGSVTVYLLMAACSAGSKHGSSRNDEPEPTASQGGMTAPGGTEAVANAGTSMPNGASGDANSPGGGVSGGIGGMIGDMMDPVDDADAAPATSGTRLRARYYVGEDGSRQFIGWHDKERNEDCNFYPTPDGKLRCTPFYVGAQITYFSESTCTSGPVTIGAKATGSACGAAAVPFAKYVYVSSACGASRQRYSTTLQPSVTGIFQKSGTACTDVSAVIKPDTYDVYALTSPVAAPDSAFVAATEQVE